MPDRGEAVCIDMDPQAGHEWKGRRPALAFSPASYYGKVGLAILCRARNSSLICDVPKAVTTEVLARLQALLGV